MHEPATSAAFSTSSLQRRGARAVAGALGLLAAWPAAAWARGGGFHGGGYHSSSHVSSGGGFFHSSSGGGMFHSAPTVHGPVVVHHYTSVYHPWYSPWGWGYHPYYYGGGGYGGGSDVLGIILLIVIIGVGFMVWRGRNNDTRGGPGYLQDDYSESYSYQEPSYQEPSTPAPALRDDSALAASFGTGEAMLDEGAQDWVRDVYPRFQSAWTKRDMATVKEYLSPKLLENYQGQVKEMKGRHEVNVIDRVNLDVVESLDAKEGVWVYIRGTMVDYVFQERSRALVSGSQTHSEEFAEYWKLVSGGSHGFMLDHIRSSEEGPPPLNKAKF